MECKKMANRTETVHNIFANIFDIVVIFGPTDSFPKTKYYTFSKQWSYKIIPTYEPCLPVFTEPMQGDGTKPNLDEV